MKRWVCLIALLSLIGLSAGEMPESFFSAMNNAGESDALAVRNYESGASLTEVYTDVRNLKRTTEIRTGGSATNASASATGGTTAGASGVPGTSGVSGALAGSPPGAPGGLEASISSNVVGTAHISWQSFDPAPDARGRHRVIGRSVEDLTGVFSIEKFIQLWSNSTPGEISVDWMPCC